MIIRTIVALTALTFGSTIAMAQATKPNDAKIAHIAYTAGQIDVKAAELAL